MLATNATISEKLTRNSVLDHPEISESMWTALHASYPANPEALVMSLRAIKQPVNEHQVSGEVQGFACRAPMQIAQHGYLAAGTLSLL